MTRIREAGDPHRTLALLWRDGLREDQEPSGRGRRPVLRLDAIIRAAIETADEEGLQGMTMSRVARRLGVATMSLYTHVPGKEDLIELMVDGALRERDLPAAGDLCAARWCTHIALYASRTRDIYRRHSWLARALSVRQPPGPGLMAQQEYLCAVLSGIGLSPSQIVTAAGMVVGFVTAQAGWEAEGRLAERESGQTADDWWAARQVLWERYFDPGRYPTISRLWHAGAYAHFQDEPDAADAMHRFGVRLLCAGIAALADENTDSNG